VNVNVDVDVLTWFLCVSTQGHGLWEVWKCLVRVGWMCKGGGGRVYKAWFSLGKRAYQVVDFEGQFWYFDYLTLKSHLSINHNNSKRPSKAVKG